MRFAFVTVVGQMMVWFGLSLLVHPRIGFPVALEYFVIVAVMVGLLLAMLFKTDDGVDD